MGTRKEYMVWIHGVTNDGHAALVGDFSGPFGTRESAEAFARSVAGARKVGKVRITERTVDDDDDDDGEEG